MISDPKTAIAVGKNLKWLGILTLILGVLAIFSPLMTGLSVVVVVGFFVIAGGITRMIWAFQAVGLGSALLRFSIGGLTMLCGLILVTDPIFASGVLTVLIALYLVFDGVVDTLAAFRLRPTNGWGWILFEGVLSILLGVMIWKQYPLSGAWAIGLFLGVKLLLIGMTMIGAGRLIRRSI